ncbi:hypothetical protein O4220_23925 [Rhodococcus ruber]|uniref:GGDEF domain-containing protein n=1 Tax=Rhodococcus ruber TaxID=1830 RepID=A0ABT4MKS0_9NOCA|nr:hypothetical protein [Rhodococcus ruber]MCZ4521579.1 hypothetical protein [Rhodococcus ruber]
MGRHRESTARTAPTHISSGARTYDEPPDPLLRTGVLVQTLLFGLVGIGKHDVDDDIAIPGSIGGSLPHMDRSTSRQIFDGTLAAADAALFTAKRNGRNCSALDRPHITESPNRE